METIKTEKIKRVNLQSVQRIQLECSYRMPCPNCGKEATRRYFYQSNLIETACESCDYLLVSCEETGNVIEAYAPGISR